MEVWVVAIANPDRHLVVEELSKHIQGQIVPLDPNKTTIATTLSTGTEFVFCRKNVSGLAREYKGQIVLPFSKTGVDLSLFLDLAYADYISQTSEKPFFGAFDSHCLHGVDINRNFETAGFGLDPITASKTSDQYRGESKGSELETQAIQSIIIAAAKKATRQSTKVRILIDVHTKKLGYYIYEDLFKDTTGIAILDELRNDPARNDPGNDTNDAMTEGRLEFIPSVPDGSCEDFARSNGVIYPITLEISKAGAGSYPAKDSAGKAIPVETLTAEAKNAILRALEAAVR
jgi:hypothetical protein